MVNRSNRRGRVAQAPARVVRPPPNPAGTWVFVDSSADSWKNLYGALTDWQKELMARKWLKSQRLFWGAEHRLVNCFFAHLSSCCRQPAGRADGSRGSQQCAFEMEVPDMMCLGVLHITPQYFESHRNARYNINAENLLEWKSSAAIDSYYMDDMSRMSDWVAFETRDVVKHLPAFGSSKGVVDREEGVKVVATLIPPFIVELCRRSHDRLVLSVTFNLFTFNDLGGLDLPPCFPYAQGERMKFRQLAIKNIMGMANSNIHISRLMLTLLPPAYREGEDEGEETEYPEEEEETEA